MIHLTRYGRRMRLIMISALSVACFACLFAIPFIEKKLLKNEVGYYSVVVDGKIVGSSNSKEEAQQAIVNARLKFSRDYSTVVYLNPDIEIVRESRTFAKREPQAQLESSVYSNLFSSIVAADKNLAYTLRIKDYAVTLASKDDVIALLEKVMEKYDTNHAFQVNLEASDDGAAGSYSVEVEKSDDKTTDTNIVAKALNGTTKSDESSTAGTNTAITGLSFVQSVQVCETSATGAGITSVQDAFDAITKVTEEKQLYTVQAGDTFTSIAQSHGTTVEKILDLNGTLTANSILAAGDVIMVTEPQAQLSVVTTKRTTYEEDYHAQPQYVDDNKSNRGINSVVSQGTTGHRKVTADVTYVNGIQTSVNYVDQEVTAESKPDVISVGTLTSSAYTRPVSGGTLSGAYGETDGSFHKGVDWAVPAGTAVNAAAAGRVSRAGWYSDYGYCIDITHADGSLTRYGHLQSINVSVGQNVSQGQQIAYSGSTGNSNEPNLHFEIWIGGNAVNPMNYVNKN